MLFHNSMLLLGALGILIPIIIHLLNRRSNRVVEWGAMNFLFESFAIRNRRIQLEEALLMASRCLLVGLLALALARPFIPPGSYVPWLLVMPLLLIGVVGLGVGAVFHASAFWRRLIVLASVLVLLLAAALIAFEKHLNFGRFGGGGRSDVAIIIDASTSMVSAARGETNFQRAVSEARDLIKRAPRGQAFSLILGGPAPTAKVLDPTTDRAELEAMLDELRPLDGPLAAYDALKLAALGLAQGDNTAKQVVIFTDKQKVGWEIGQTGRWNFLRDAFRNLPSEPQIVLRALPLPDRLRNLSVSEISFSRSIVGVDRAVDILVTIENTGNEAVTPQGLELVTGKTKLHNQRFGQIQPGATDTVTFSHQFSEPGSQLVTATLKVDDEILQDNSRVAALNVAAGLRALLVDGRAASRFLDRATSFAALALAPTARTVDPSAAVERIADPDQEDDDAAIAGVELRFLVEPQVASASELVGMKDLSTFDVVVLADVARLPAETTLALEEFVKTGGGLLVAPGQKAEPAFYNEWREYSGKAFLPGALAKNLAVSPVESPAHPNAQSFVHPALAKLGAKGKSDFPTLSLQYYWPLTVPDDLSADVNAGGRIDTGDPLLLARRFGAGQIVQLAFPLDASAGNLPTRATFLPFVHELVYQLADPAAWNLNLDPGWDVALSLPGARGAVVGQGLRGAYFSDADARTPVLTRIDPAIDFRWNDQSPGPGVPTDHFRVEWTGRIKVPVSGSYRFDGEADDSLEVLVDGSSVVQLGYGRNNRGKDVKLDAGKFYDLKATFREDSGNALAVLYWQSRQLPRQVVPATALRSSALGALAPLTGGDASVPRDALAVYQVMGPDDRPRQAYLLSGDKGASAKLVGDISAGAYRLSIPEDHRGFFSRLLPPGSQEAVFTVKRDPSESRLEALTAADFSFLEKFVTLVRPGTLEETLSIVAGRSFGEELWKYLALGAFVFLLAEIALSRWIAIRQRMGEEIKVEFTTHEGPSGGFQDQLKKIKASVARTGPL
ncbi:MAG: PA14 domain-containing protein [Verrucomicrobiales bacterium]